MPYPHDDLSPMRRRVLRAKQNLGGSHPCRRTYGNFGGDLPLPAARTAETCTVVSWLSAETRA